MELLFVHLSDELLKAICWTLIHSLWQGALAAALAGIIILFTRKTTARLRYNLLGNVLILFVLATCVTFCIELRNTTPVEEPALQPGLSAITIPDFTTEVISPDPTSFIDNVVAYFNAHADWFVLVWALFCIVHVVKISTGLTGVGRMRRQKVHPSGDWQARLDQLARQLGIRQTIRLLQSELVKMPVAVGFFKPMILVPLGLLSHLPPEQVETILLHELAHIRRRDYLVNLLQCLAEALFFFNPALLWVSSLLRQEREACCDDIVVAHTVNKGSYLEALVSFHEYSFTPSYAMGIGGKRYYLLNRVKRMLTRENKKLNLMEKSLLLLGITAMTAFTFIPRNEPVIIKSPLTITANPVMAASLSVPVSPQAPVAGNARQATWKKEDSKPVPEQKHVTIPDTVPSIAKNAYDALVFSNVSSSVNNNNGIRDETTTVTDQQGKKYMIRKLNNKITALVIDGKAVPENELGNHAVLLGKIEGAVHSKKQDEWKVKQKEWEQKGKEWEIKGKQIEKDMKEKQKEFEQKRKEKEKEIEQKRKEREKEFEQKRKEKEKEFEQKRKEKEKEFEQKRKEKERESEQKRKENDRVIKERQQEAREKQREAQEKARELRGEQQEKRGTRRNEPRKEVKKDTLRISGNYNLQFNQNRQIQANINANINQDVKLAMNAMHFDVKSPGFDFVSKIDLQTKLNFNINLPVPPKSPDAKAAPAADKRPKPVR